MTERIHDLTERLQRLWRQPWHQWTPDREARTAYLQRLKGEAFADKRRERAGRTDRRGM